MSELTRDQILGSTDQRIVAVEVPEWGGTVHVRTMTGRERDEWECSLIVDLEARTFEHRRDNLRSRLLVRVLCDATGKPLFTAADIAALGEKSGTALDRVYATAATVNRLSRSDIEELEKNSAAGLSAGTG